MFFVYRLQSIHQPNQFYTGFTRDVCKRLEAHNNGQVSHTAKYKLWKLLNYFVFVDEKKSYGLRKVFEIWVGKGIRERAFIRR